MSNAFHFSLVSPEQELMSKSVAHVIVPGAQGDFGVLPGHAPFMATLRPGALIIEADGECSKVFVRGGFADVTPEGLTVLAEEAAPMDAMDPADVEVQLQDAQAVLAKAEGDADQLRAQGDVDRLEALKAALSDRTYDS